jgi:hypothetical protein
MNARGNTIEDQNYIMQSACDELSLLKATVDDSGKPMFSQIDFDSILRNIPFIFSTEPTINEKSSTLTTLRHIEEMFVQCPLCKRMLHNSVCDVIVGCCSCGRGE